jgi:hypothetical protein
MTSTACSKYLSRLVLDPQKIAERAAHAGGSYSYVTESMSPDLNYFAILIYVNPPSTKPL